MCVIGHIMHQGVNILEACSAWYIVVLCNCFYRLVMRQGTQSTVLQLFLRYSVKIYKCATQHISGHKPSQQEPMWVAKVMVRVHIATEVLHIFFILGNRAAFHYKGFVGDINR